MRGLLSRFSHPAEVPVPETTTPVRDDKEGGTVNNEPRGSETTDHDVDAIDADAQAGVKKIEATTKVWSRSNLILAYLL